ncbi:MAG: apolipoprotein N-acyltransferase [Ilumatobacteraceae bacterium]
MTRRLPSRAAIGALAGGVLVALSLPPWGFWPLAIIGIAMFETALGASPTVRQRLTRGWLFGAGWLYLGMCWMWFLSAPGYVVAGALFAGLHAAAAGVAPTGPWRVVGRPAAHTLAEVVRIAVPFGGVPLATLPIGQAGGPFAGVVGVGGVVGLTWVVFQLGFALAGPAPAVPQLARAWARSVGAATTGSWHGVAAAAVAVGVWVIAPFADHAVSETGEIVRIAAVQGGGVQGTRAISTSSREVTERHLVATATIEVGSVDLVVWPENVIDVDGQPFTASREFAEVADEAARLGVPFVVGVTEDDPTGSAFLNAQVVVTPDGEAVSRYEKVRRVPFGEYMPMRGLLAAIGAPVDLVPRDALAGTGPALITAPTSGPMAVVISWEVFFGGRANEGVERGGGFILNPTNGSSYTWTVLQSQQIASSQLRAREQSRTVVQVAPTGFSAFITPEGDVRERTGVSEQQVIIDNVAVRSGRTWYSYLGDRPWIIAAAGVLVLAILRSRRVSAGRSGSAASTH